MVAKSLRLITKYMEFEKDILCEMVHELFKIKKALYEKSESTEH